MPLCRKFDWSLVWPFPSFERKVSQTATEHQFAASIPKRKDSWQTSERPFLLFELDTRHSWSYCLPACIFSFSASFWCLTCPLEVAMKKFLTCCNIWTSISMWRVLEVVFLCEGICNSSWLCILVIPIYNATDLYSLVLLGYFGQFPVTSKYARATRTFPSK